MYAVKQALADELQEIRDAGLFKVERELTSPQSSHVTTKTADDLKAEALNFCANNYLGLADHPDVVAAAHAALDEWGFGMASVRFICGTQAQHRDLERTIADFVGTQDAILFPSCFDANGGIFEVLFGPEDAIISDELNHASIIDGVRLSKAQRFRYRNRDMTDLRTQLEAAAGARGVETAEGETHSQAYRALDVTILQDIVLDRCLGISVDQVTAGAHVSYAKEWDEALHLLGEGAYQAGFFLNPTQLEQVREIATTGERMPQKSTYFYPKLPTGLLFHDLADGI